VNTYKVHTPRFAGSYSYSNDSALLHISSVANANRHGRCIQSLVQNTLVRFLGGPVWGIREQLDRAEYNG